VYDAIINAANQRGIRPQSIQHVTAPEEAFPFVADGSAIAFVVKTGALLLARNWVTVRPLIVHAAANAQRAADCILGETFEEKTDTTDRANDEDLAEVAA